MELRHLRYFVAVAVSEQESLSAPEQFASTHWSVVLQAGKSPSPQSAEALELANRGLAGQPTGGASLADITLVTAEVFFRATAETNYLIAVDGYDGVSGDIALELVAGAPRLGPVTLLAGGELKIGIEGELGRLYTIEASADLVTWSPVAMVENASGSLQFVDPEATSAISRFYRVVFEP